jgi:hypothetical protein
MGAGGLGTYEFSMNEGSVGLIPPCADALWVGKGGALALCEAGG